MNLLQMSLSAALIIAVITIIRSLAVHHLPKITFVVLWGIALCRLLIPVSWSSSWSIYNFMNPFPPNAEATVKHTPSLIDNPALAAAPLEKVIEADLPAVTMLSPFVILWLAGVMISASYFIVTYYKCYREFQTSLPVDNPSVIHWLQQHQISRQIQVRQSDRIHAPLTYGVFRPVILLPSSMDWSDEEQLKYILTHEYVHIRRFDALTKLLLTAALCLHWFNPFVWVMYILANRDIELSCDESVVRLFGDTSRSTYALTLIHMEEQKSRMSPLLNHFSKNSITERITAIMKMKKTSLIGFITAVVLITGTTSVLATSAKPSVPQLLVPEDQVQNQVEHVSTTSSIMMQRKDRETGQFEVSLDGGQSWISKEQYEQQNSIPDVEWYTYDEYKAYVDEQKKVLPTYIGEKAERWDGETQSMKSFTWTQEFVDEAIKVLEKNLEDLKNGKKISKMVNGSNEVQFIYNQGEISIGSSHDFSAYDENGDWKNFGPYETRKELEEAVKSYYKAQLEAGKITQPSYEKILRELEVYI